MANTKIQTVNKQKVEVTTAPKISIFDRRPSMFSGGSLLNQRGVAPKSFISPAVRITQHKGGGGK